MARAITIPNELVGQDSSVEYTSRAIPLDQPNEAIQYEIVWETGVVGVFVFEGALVQIRFTPVVNCKTIEVSAGGLAGSEIVSLTGVWMSLGFVRFHWIPAAGSTGTFSVVLRIVPR